MISERVFRLGQLAIALGSLITGAYFYFHNQTLWSERSFAIGTAIILFFLLIDVVRSLAKGELGLDLVALASMSGCLLIGENLAGNVVALMLTGGQMLEDYARARARRGRLGRHGVVAGRRQARARPGGGAAGGAGGRGRR